MWMRARWGYNAIDLGENLLIFNIIGNETD